MRIAELAASMLWAAPLLALLTVPAPPLLGIDPSSDPQQLAYLFGMALLGTWTALVPNKVIETRRFDRTTRRLIGSGWRTCSWASSVRVLARTCDSA